MKNVFLVFFLIAFGARSGDCQSLRKSPSSLLAGKWSYKSGHYIYFDSSNRKLKQSKVTDLKDLNVEVAGHDVKIIFPGQVYNTPYELSSEKGRRYISMDLGSGLIKYQILSLNNKSLTLKSRHNINFYADGDPNKKVAYSIFIINMVKQQSQRKSGS